MWFFLGAGGILVMQFAWVAAHGGNWTLLLRVGSEMPHRDFMEHELGPLKMLDTVGHDGQLNYIIARDPFFQDPTLSPFQSSPYRWRRILYPALAGGFGKLSPSTTLIGMVILMMVGGGLNVVACLELGQRWWIPGWILAIAMLNPGGLLSAQILTCDLLAMGLGFAGVAMWYRRLMTTSWLLFVAAVLTKETSAMMPGCLAIVSVIERKGRFRAMFQDCFVLGSTVFPWLVWSAWLSSRMSGGSGMNNFDLPGVGLFQSISKWPGLGLSEIIVGSLAVALVVASAILGFQTTDRYLRVSCIAWTVLAMTVAQVVWLYPGNLLRALAPLWTFAALAYGQMRVPRNAV